MGVINSKKQTQSGGAGRKKKKSFSVFKTGLHVHFFYNRQKKQA